MANGKVVQVIGSVVDVEFPPDAMPALFNALEIKNDDGSKLVLEVQAHVGGNWVKCLALMPTDVCGAGLKPWIPGRHQSPVGKQSLGRIFNVMGGAGYAGDHQGAERWPIHRNPPAFDEQKPAPRCSKPVSKSLTLLHPLPGR